MNLVQDAQRASWTRFMNVPATAFGVYPGNKKNTTQAITYTAINCTPANHDDLPSRLTNVKRMVANPRITSSRGEKMRSRCFAKKRLTRTSKGATNVAT